MSPPVAALSGGLVLGVVLYLGLAALGLALGIRWARDALGAASPPGDAAPR